MRKSLIAAAAASVGFAFVLPFAMAGPAEATITCTPPLVLMHVGISTFCGTPGYTGCHVNCPEPGPAAPPPPGQQPLRGGPNSYDTLTGQSPCPDVHAPTCNPDTTAPAPPGGGAVAPPQGQG
jgi:hypothetical protein